MALGLSLGPLTKDITVDLGCVVIALQIPSPGTSVPLRSLVHLFYQIMLAVCIFKNSVDR